jgi:hypothetical protein
VLGMRVSVACLADTTLGELWTYGDPNRPFIKRKKDELDLIRLAEAFPELRAMYPVGVLPGYCLGATSSAEVPADTVWPSAILIDRALA